MPRIESDDPLRRPLADRDIGRKQRGIEKRPEPREEEHHLGSDEEDHAVAQTQLHHRRVVASNDGLPPYVAPPAGHGVKDEGEADEEDPGLAVYRQSPEPRIAGVHPEYGPDQHQARARGAHDGPWAGIDQMIIVMHFAV